MWLKNKRWEDKDTPRRRTSIISKLLVMLTGKRKDAIVQNFIYHWRKISDYDDVVRYIKKNIPSQKEQTDR